MDFTPELIGAWIAVFLTLAIFSYLYDDNPFYKAAEHLYVGVSAGFIASLAFWQQLQPNMFGRFWPKVDPEAEMSTLKSIWYFCYDALSFIVTGFGILERGIFPENGIEGFKNIELLYIIPFILGIFMLLRLVPNLGWLARWAIAYIVGMAGGLRFYSFLNSDIMEQIKSASIDFSGDWATIINAIILLIGTLTGLLYFFFSKEHTGIVGKLSKVGIYFLMVSFGASFGFAVMGRISLLIGRIQDLKVYSGPEFHNATYWIAGIMILTLAFWAFKKPKETVNAG